jgi:hypothetical protein
VIGIIIFYSKDLCKKSINIYLRVLAISDILILLNYITSYNFVYEENRVLRYILLLILHFNICFSLQIMLSLTWLRTRAVSSPFWLKRFNSKSFTYRYIIGIAVTSIVLSFFILISMIGVYAILKVYYIKLDHIRVYYSYCMSTVYFVPSVIMLLLNIKLIRNIQRNDVVPLRFYQNVQFFEREKKSKIEISIWF